MNVAGALALTGLVLTVVTIVLAMTAAETRSYRLTDRLKPLVWTAFGLAVVFFLSAIWSGVA